MTDEYLLERGYKEYPPTSIDNESIVSRFQKRFDNKIGKKYFINVLKWSHDFVPEHRRDKWWTPFSYEYEVQVATKEEDYMNITFHSSWTLEKVEKFMDDFFYIMNLKYYETWDEC